MSNWIAGQVAGLMDRLAAIPSATGTGTLLDETTIYWFNRHGDGDSHANFALPNVTRRSHRLAAVATTEARLPVVPC
jgi:hypothetical protein